MDARRDLLAEEQGRRQCLMREMIAGRQVHRASRRSERALDRVWTHVEAMPMLVGIDDREHRPAVSVARRDLDGALESFARLGMIR